MCGGTGSILGAALGYALAPVTGGASLALAYTAAGAAAGDMLVDKPQKQMKEAMSQQQTATNQALETAKQTADEATATNQKIVNDFNNANNQLVNEFTGSMKDVTNSLGGANAQTAQGVQALMRAPDFAAMLYRNQKREKSDGGGSATMLTGPQGVDMSALNLGKNTILGG